MSTMRVSASVGVLVLTVGASLQAQTAPPGKRVYLVGGYSLAWENGATEDGSYEGLRSPGGRIDQWWIGAGRRVARAFALEAGVERTGRIDSVQYRYFGHGNYEGTLLQRRDTAFFFNGRYAGQRGAIGFEPFFTVGLIWEQSWIAEADGYTSGGLTEQDFPEPAPYANSFGLAAGAGFDLRIGGGALAILPVRIRAFSRGGDVWTGGATTWSQEARVGLRVAF